MLNLIRNFFAPRQRGFHPFRRRQTGLAHTMGAHRGGVALGTLATVAAPFIVRKLMARRAARNYASTAAY
jgi:hypothetical protein